MRTPPLPLYGHATYPPRNEDEKVYIVRLCPPILVAEVGWDFDPRMILTLTWWSVSGAPVPAPEDFLPPMVEYFWAAVMKRKAPEDAPLRFINVDGTTPPPLLLVDLHGAKVKASVLLRSAPPWGLFLLPDTLPHTEKLPAIALAHEWSALNPAARALFHEEHAWFLGHCLDEPNP